MFAADARDRPMALRTVQLCRDQVRAAVTALVASGADPSQLTALADLVSPRNFKAILTHRYESHNGLANSFDTYLARALIRIAREWVKLGATELAELNRLAARLPKLTSGLTKKNRAALRQFDDLAAFQRLHALPDELWKEVKHDRRHNRYTLANAQAALAIGLLLYAPIRLQNLASLHFGVHLFVRQGPGPISTLEIPAPEVKNRRDLAFDLPRQDAAGIHQQHCAKDHRPSARTAVRQHRWNGQAFPKRGVADQENVAQAGWHRTHAAPVPSSQRADRARRRTRRI
jgi:hypothetical protein